MIRARFLSTSPFSHRQERATTKLAVTYLCPTPYAIKVALLVGAIRAGFDPEEFTKRIRSVKLLPQPWGEGVVNTHLVKHWEPPRDDNANKPPPTHLGPTVVFREFVYFDGGVDIYLPDETADWIVPILPYVNSFGKQGSFFSYLLHEEAELPKTTTHIVASDMSDSATWEKVSNFLGETKKPRDTEAWISIRAELISGGSSHKYYRFGE